MCRRNNNDNQIAFEDAQMPACSPSLPRRAPLRLIGTLALLAAASPALAASSADPLWPCIQPKVPSLAVAQMWEGPPIEKLNWRADPQISELVPIIAARRTPLDEADTMIDAFAADAGANKKERLTLLFAGVFDEINALRSRILTGIERYSQHQIDLAKRIREESLQLAKAKKGAASDDDKAKTVELEKEVLWDTRIYDARNQAVTAVCESPVILEQRIFALSRSIQNVMD